MVCLSEIRDQRSETRPQTSKLLLCKNPIAHSCTVPCGLRQFAGPQLCGTRTESVRFHDAAQPHIAGLHVNMAFTLKAKDISTYTGVHANGGPDAVAKGTHQISKTCYQDILQCSCIQAGSYTWSTFVPLPPSRGRHWQRAVGFFSLVICSTGATSMNMNDVARVCAGSAAGLCRERWTSPVEPGSRITFVPSCGMKGVRAMALCKTSNSRRFTTGR